MRVILNSDVLYTGRLVRILPTSWERFAHDCASVAAVLTFPRTALLEIERQQKELVAIDISELQRARGILASYGIGGPDFVAEDVVPIPDIVALFKATGAKVETVEPIMADYQGAERRAALHLAPLRPQSESDEMRDLVIWEVACRLAKAEGGAVLLSHDHVHTGADGNEEAAKCGLQRVKSFDSVLDIIGVEGPRAKLAARVLDGVWDDLRKSLPLPKSNSVRRLTDISFIQGEPGIALVRFGFRAKTIDGHTLAGNAEIRQVKPDQLHITLTNLSVGPNSFEPSTIEMVTVGVLPRFAGDVTDRLQDLRELLGQ